MATVRKPASKAKPRPGKGRPSRYHPAYAAQAEELISTSGATDARLAKVFGIARETVTKWRKAHKDFREACERGRDAFDVGAVEKSLLTRALGYRTKKITQEPVLIKGEKDDAPTLLDKRLHVTKVVSERVAGDVGAIRYFLNNRAPGRWKDKVHVDGEVAHKHDLPPAVQSMLEAIYGGGAQAQACSASHVHETASDDGDQTDPGEFDPLAGLGLSAHGSDDGAGVSA